MSSDRQLAQELGKVIGFGRMMQLGSELWRESLLKDWGIEGGEFVVGPCASMMVACPCTAKDKAWKCDICCGTGQITKGVLALLEKKESL